MIAVDVKLVSAFGRDRDQELTTLIIDNITTEQRHVETGGRRGDYRVRAYRKGALAKADGDHRKMVHDAKPTREGRVYDHARLAEPVGNLVAKAMKDLGYA